MGVKWLDKEVMNKGLEELYNNIDRVYVLKTYAKADVWATVSANKIAEYTITTGTESHLQDNGTYGREVMFDAQTGNTADQPSGAGPDLHLAYVDVSNTKVYFVTDEATDVVINISDTVNVPQIELRMDEPL